MTKPLELIGEIELEEQELVGEVEVKNEIVIDLSVGARGKSTYEIWLEEGNEGTREDFINDMRGKDGDELYLHPETHSADMIEETPDRLFMTTTEKKLALETYVHDQMVATDIWVVQHNLDKYPSVSIVDTAQTVVMGSVEYTNKNKLIIRFSVEFSGKAFLN